MKITLAEAMLIMEQLHGMSWSELKDNEKFLFYSANKLIEDRKKKLGLK